MSKWTESEAFKWYKLAAKRGNKKAQYRLGLKYKEGSGVEKSNIYAHMWLNIAASRNYKEATKALDELASTMKESDIDKATQLADSCKKTKYHSCSIEN